MQPLIAPLYDGHSPHELMSVLNGQPDASGYDLVRANWQSQAKGGGTFEEFWRRSIHDGFIAGTEFQPKSVKVKSHDFPADAR